MTTPWHNPEVTWQAGPIKNILKNRCHPFAVLHDNSNARIPMISVVCQRLSMIDFQPTQLAVAARSCHAIHHIRESRLSFKQVAAFVPLLAHSQSPTALLAKMEGIITHPCIE